MKLAALVMGLAMAAGSVGVLASLPQRAAWSTAHTERMRGTNAYYDARATGTFIGPLSLRLNGEPEVYLVIAYTFTWRRGYELRDPDDLIQANRSRLVDALLSRLPELSAKELGTRQGKLALKRFLSRVTQEQIFPQGEGRVQKIWLDRVLLQPTRMG